jgi:hypothetical protein
MPRKVPNIQRIINNDILIRFPALLPRITRVEGSKLSNYFMGHKTKISPQVLQYICPPSCNGLDYKSKFPLASLSLPFSIPFALF